MNFQLLSTTPLSLKQQTQWILYSEQSKGFVIGDEQSAFVLPVANPGSPAVVQKDPSAPAACNLPVSAAIYDELAGESWHGFRFLERRAYEGIDGDLLRTLVFGPDYGHYVIHPPSGLVLSLRGGLMKLLKQAGTKFEAIDDTKTRGKAALAFAGHPTEPLTAYGDNYGTFHAHRFDESGFGKATKIAAKERKASRLEFDSSGSTLLIGGMGYLATFAYAGGKFARKHESAVSVRDFDWHEASGDAIVNQGMHGVSAYRYGDSGFTKLGEAEPEGAVNQLSVSKDRKHLAVTFQESTRVSMYRVSRV